MRTHLRMTALATLITSLALTLAPVPAGAQFGDIVKKAQKKTKAKVDAETDKAMDDALDGPDKKDAAKPAKAAARGKPGEGVWVNYDFVPGARVLFYEDFTADEVGNFPRRLEFIKGNMEVAEWEGRRWLRASSRSDFEIHLPDNLPDGFTVELEYMTNGNTMALVMRTADKSHPYLSFRGHISGVQGSGVSSTTRTQPPFNDRPFHCRVMADGNYVKVYSNEIRTANTPKAPLGRTNVLAIHMPGTASNPVMLTSLRIAESRKKIYDELQANGTVALQGILFATDSDVIQPESTPTLEEMAHMLKAHPDLRLVIEGHTDNRGDDASNQTLSERRAQAVRAYLVERHGVDAARLTARGHGEAKPLDSNDTAEGRQNNRRVQLSMES